MATNKLTWDSWCPSQLNIVLLGGRNSGKSHVGNLLLGKEEFVTKERTSCSRRLGVVDGLRITVVDTPGWWCDFSARDTSELVKREIVSSVSLCSPGPHVFLITVKATSAFTERRRRAVEEHVDLLGDKVWRNCILVLISTDRPKHTETGELVQTGGEAFSWLRDKCSQRCCTVIWSDNTNAAGLLETIQQLVTANENRVFEMQEEILQVAAEEKRQVEERARQRFMRVKRHRALMRERLRPVSNIRIVLLGARGSGKTSALNTILGRDSSRGPGRTAKCMMGAGAVFGRQLTVVDTPGWWMNYFLDETPVFDRREMVLGLSLCPPGPHVFLLVIRVDKAFSETYRRAAEEHLQLLGENIWSRVIILFTFGDWLGGTTTEQFIESEGEPLWWLVERCSNRYHILNNKTKGDGFQVTELIGKIEEMLTGCTSGQHYEMERRSVQRLEEKRSWEKERAEERWRRKEKQRQAARSQLEMLIPLPELRIVLVGGGKTGKSSCGNTILGSDIFSTASQTISCSEGRANISGKSVTVLDTSGCFSVTSDLLTPFYVVLLVVNVSSSFKGAHLEAVEKQMEAGGDQMWSRALVLFSHGDWLGDTGIEQRIESEGKALQKLVEKCGNRYHVLDNKNRGDGAQVGELVELMEEVLVEGRMEDLNRGDPVWRDVSSARRQQMEKVMLCGRDVTSCRLQTSTDSAEPSSSSAHTPMTWAGEIVAAAGGGGGGQIEGRTRHGDHFLSFLASLLSGKRGLKWTINPPVWFPSDDLHLRLNGDSQVCLPSSRRPRIHPEVLSVASLCHPVLREQTLRRLTQTGDLQALLDQWGHSSLEELEAFIDAYFEMVWEQTMGSVQEEEPVDQGGELKEEEEVLSSIDRKLSKLELLEDIKRDVSELRKSLELSWRAIEELRAKSQQDQNTSS